jgi:hypothetical protein
MNKFERVCKVCGTTMFYKSKDSYLNSIRKNTLCQSCGGRLAAKKDSNMGVLLEETNESYYWIGFILADGHINKSNRLKVVLAIKDFEHLNKLKNFLNIQKITNTTISSSIAAMDVEIINILCKKFDINQNKTIHPPNLEIFKNINNKDLLLSLIAGFIDGDGSIRNQSMGRKDFKLEIKCHKNWLSILQFFCLEICKKDFTKINNQGYAYFCISDTVILKELKRSIELLNIPILKRKWDIIDYNYQGRSEKASKTHPIILNLFQNGCSIIDISKKLKIPYGTVYQTIKRNDEIKLESSGVTM